MRKMPSYNAVVASSSQHTHLPPWSMQNNAELAYFLRSITLRTLPHNFKAQTYSYIVFKCVLLTVGLLLVLKLLFTGRWWVVRVVRVPRGYLVCPNACEALVVAACTFYFVDLFYRGFSLRWHYDPDSTQHGMPALYAIRLFFLWLAGFIHNAASFLVFPLNPARVRPLYWHLFLFGMPLAFLAAYVPPVVMTERAYRLGNALAIPLIRSLDANPDAPVSPEDVLEATLVNEHVYVAWAHLRQYAIVGLAFLLFITLSTLFTGVAITRRTWQRYNAVKRSLLHDDESQRQRARESGVLDVTDEQQADNIMSMTGLSSHDHEAKYDRMRTASSGTETTTTNAPQPASQNGDRRSALPWHKLTQRRRALYLIGLAPLKDIDANDNVHSRPTVNSVVAVLRDFLRFCILQFTCLLLIELTMLACAVLVITTIQRDLRSDARIPTYGTPFVRTSYVYFVLEIWVIVAVGSPLIVLMLWRQIYPIHIDFSADVYTRKSALRPSGNSMLRGGGEARSVKAEDNVKRKASVSGSLTAPDSAKTAQMPWSPSTPYTTFKVAQRSATGGVQNVDDDGEEDGDRSDSMHRRKSSARLQHTLSRIIGAREKDGLAGMSVHSSSPSPSLRESVGSEDGKPRTGSSNTAGGDGDSIPLHSRTSVIVGHQPRHTEDIAARDACGFLGPNAGVRSIVLQALDSSKGHSGAGALRNRTLSRWEERQQGLQSSSPPPPPSSPPPPFSRIRLASVGSFRRPSVPLLTQPDEPHFATAHGVIKQDPSLASP